MESTRLTILFIFIFVLNRNLIYCKPTTDDEQSNQEVLEPTANTETYKYADALQSQETSSTPPIDDVELKQHRPENPIKLPYSTSPPSWNNIGRRPQDRGTVARVSETMKEMAQLLTHDNGAVLTHVLKLLADLVPIRSPFDRFTTYGQHIANKLRKYPRKIEAIIEHKFNEILYEADMGQYDLDASVLLTSSPAESSSYQYSNQTPEAPVTLNSFKNYVPENPGPSSRERDNNLSPISCEKRTSSVKSLIELYDKKLV